MKLYNLRDSITRREWNVSANSMEQAEDQIIDAIEKEAGMEVGEIEFEEVDEFPSAFE